VNIMASKSGNQTISEDHEFVFDKGELNYSIVKRFENIVSQYPDQVAIKTKSEQVTYNELNRIANRTAHQITKVCSSKQQRISLLFDHGIDMIASMIGTLKSCNLYIPLDSSYPVKRLEYILEDSQSVLIMTNGKNLELAKKLVSTSKSAVDLINIDLISSTTNEQNLNLLLDPEHLAYLLYTSGSTGLPKGVIQSHRNVLHFIRNYTNQLHITPKSRMSLLPSFSSDAAVMDVYSSLLNGATLIPYNVKEEASMTVLTKWLSDEQISIWHSTPTLYRYFTNELSQLETFKELQYIVLGGESVTPNDLMRFKSFFPKTTLVNLYGQTESSFNSLQFFTSDSNEEEITLGEVVEDTDILLLNEDGEEANFFEIAEIYICSDYLALGYWRKEEIANEVFIDNHPIFEGRFYRTGDLGQLLPDGRIQFAGRKDFQVKIRGYRVEVREIEDKLIEYPPVKECIVVALEDKQGEKYLCAYTVADLEIKVEELRSHLSNELPDYMIPALYVQLEEIPLTPSGKIDRNALPKPEDSLSTANEYVAPSNKIEELLVRIWSDVLDAEKIGVLDNFFSLGGHSLKATQMVTKINQEMEVSISLRDVFLTPTIQGLAQYIQASEKTEYMSIDVVEEREYYPVSTAQKRLYILQQFEEETVNYNMPRVLEMKGDLDKERLEAAFKALVQRHDSLRTSFDIVEDKPVQRVHREVDFSFGYTEAKKEEMDQIISSFIRPFDLSHAPLLRVELVRVAEEHHFFLFDMHHIISDGVSMNIVINDLMSFYEEKELPNLRVQYKDFSVWENNIIAADEMKKQEAYWHETFREEIPVLELPTDYTRPVIKDAAGDLINFMINSETLSQMQEIAKQNGATLYMVLLAAYNVLLSRYSGQTDIVVGSPTAGRSHADLEHTVGMFVNTLALRNSPLPDQSFETFLSEVKEQTLQIYEHQDYPFELLVEKLGVQRDTSRSPLFDVMFVLQNMKQTVFEIEGLTLSPYGHNHPIAKFDLTLTVVESESGLRCSLEYRTSLFKRESIERLAGHFTQILEHIAEQPSIVLKEIGLLTANEKKQQLVEFNNTEVAYPKDKTIQQLFEEQVQKTPDHVALVFEEQELTYKELNEKANQLARVLRTKGVQADDIVALKVDRSLEMIIGIFGIMKAGGAYLPIDPNYPEERIQYVLKDSEAKLILTQQHLSMTNFDGDVIDLDVIDLEDKTLYTGDYSNLGTINTSRDLAYVIYTSGSTGNPKGVMVEHRSITNFIHGMMDIIEFKAENVIVSLTTISFDIFIVENVLPLTCGLKVIIANNEQQKTPELLSGLITKHGVNTLQMTPSHIKLLMNNESNWNSLSELKQILVGGEALTDSLLEQLQQRTKASIYNVYGPTETTVWSIAKDLTKEKEVTIGKPISNTKIYIVDPVHHLLPIGVTGELCIAGDGLARGYLHRPGLTAEKFVENPFVAGERMYKTGDLARWLPDGNIEYMGRKDHQVKIRGYRIELGEIEHQVLNHVAVKEAVVVDRVDAHGDKFLCAYIVTDQELTIEAMRSHLVQSLPEYMIPSSFVPLEEMPLTPNGKINRKALPEPDGSLSTGTEYVAPRNKVEEVLALLWSGVLGVEKVGVLDNFFSLGGHSLKATVMMAKVAKEMGVKVPLRELFRTPTIIGLAQYIQETEKQEYRAIEVVEERNYYPVSAAQKRLYILQQFEEETINYNMPNVVEMKGALDKERLENAFKSLIQRHEALRTSFDIVEEDPVQRVHREVEFWFEYSEVREDEMDQIISAFIRPFDLSHAPLLRVELVRVAEDRHFFLFDMHHIISDGVSMNLVVQDLMSFYEEKELPELRIQYKDFAVWENNQFATGEMKKQETYWQETFREEIPVLELPTDYTRPTVKDVAGDRITFTIDKETLNQLHEVARQHGATLYMVLLAAYNVLLSRYSGQEDIVVGSPIAGRAHADVEHTVGNFVNTLALRNSPEGEQSFDSFLMKVKERALQVYEHQDYPFELIVDQLGVERDTSRSPLFDVMFIMQNMEQTAFEIEGLTLSPYAFRHDVAKFDLTLSIMEKDSGLRCNLGYRTSLFKKETMLRLADHFTQILQYIAEMPSIVLKEIELLTANEEKQQLVEFNNTEVAYPKDKTIQQLFEEQVQKTPDHVALVFEEQELTYKELNEKANQLARVLRTKGVQADDIVALKVDRSLEMIIGIFGIMKAGGAYLPIDPNYPEERIQYVLKDSEAKLILTQQHLSMTNFDGDVIDLDVIDLEDKTLYTGDYSNLGTINTSRDLAYVIYTSGSTGNPKGVMVEHRSITNFIHGMMDIIEFKAENVIVSLTTISFDIFIVENVLPLTCGLKVIIANNEQQKTPELLSGLITKHGVNTLQMTPSHIKLLMNNESNWNSLSELKQILVGGEALTDSLLEQLQQRTKASIYNVYGPTETTVWSIAKDLTKEKEVTIGKPISNTKIYIVDPVHHLLPIGVTGELCIAGDGLARGYLHRPGLTAEKFVENPFVAGERMYKTGDLARWLPDGNIEYMGRKDHQVKIRGYRIELGEIEHQVLNHVAVKEAVVVDRVDAHGDKFLCAYIVTDQELTIEAMRSHLVQSLPEYMIPSSFVPLEEMPLTPNGKINRKALPEPDGSLSTGTEYVAPRNKVEEVLALLWSGVLGVEKVGVLDNFFSLGGHSLKATVMMAKVAKEMGVKVPLRELFRTPTIIGLAQYIQETEKQEYRAIEVVEERNYYPVSAAQKRLYILQQFEEETINYNMPNVVEMKGALDKERLENAFKSLIQRHEALRTSFDIVEEDPVQRVHREVEFWFEYSEVREDEMDQIISAFIRPFDLSHAPLLRVELVRVAEDRHFFLFDMHHIISDGVSMNLVVQDLMSFYEEKELPELRIQYKDFAVWENNQFATGEMKKQETYWQETFREEIPVLELPTDYTRPTVKDVAGDRITFTIDKETLNQLHEVARQHGATLYMVLLAAYNVLLSRYSGQEDIVVGSPIAGRAHADVEHTVGMFVNTLALRNFPVADQSFKSFLAQVKERSLQVYEHQDYPFELLVEKLGVQRDPSRSPLFDVMFVLQNMEQSSFGIEGITLTSYSFNHAVAKFDLTLNALETEKGLRCSLEYRTSLFKKETMQRLAGHFGQILDNIVEQPDILLKDIDLLTTEEKHQIIVDFNNTQTAYPKDKTIHCLFEEHVEKTPNHVAVILGEEQLTYRELNEKANQLARVLRSKGVQADRIVGIMVERSLEMMIGILGIMKAGGAYLPIDPDYPEERIQYVLEDSRTRLLLSQKHLHTASFNGEVLYLDDPQLYRGDTSNLGEVNQSKDLAYVMYTSGSTGKPKGNLTTHFNITRVVRNTNYVEISAKDTVIQLSNYAFDGSTFDIFGAFLNGATLVVLHKDQVLDMDQLSKVLHMYESTVFFMTAALFNMLVDTGLEHLNNIRQLIVGGDKLSVPHVRKALDHMGPGRIINGYGPTESTVFTACYAINEVKGNGASIPIGKPVANTQVYILDKQQQLLPIGVPGELCISGDGLARGYLNRPDLTVEKFVDHPYLRGEKMYKSGDIVRWLPDGSIEFIGRRDHQVKIRGFRIELGEIEHQVMKYKGIRETVIVDKLDSQGDKYLCAYFVADEEVNVEELRAQLSHELPDYMVPSFFVQLEQMPLTSNGKTDRKALPEPDRSVYTGLGYVAPRNEVEEKLVPIWSKVLNVVTVGVEDDFFALGGHSLKILAVIKEINKLFGKDYTASTLFLNPTISQLAYEIMNEQERERLESLVQLKAGKGAQNLFCVHPLGGSIHWYKDLAESLGENINFYGVQAKGLMNKNDLPATLEEMVASYIQEIKMIQKEGPYFIGGFCAGSIIAYEMVKQLEDLNEVVEICIIFDAPAPMHFDKPVPVEVINKMNDARAEAAVSVLEGDEEDEEKVIAIRQEEIEHNIINVINWYRPEKIIETDVLVVKAKEEDNRFVSREYWKEWSKGVIAEFVTPGDHFTMLEQPLVKGLGKKIKNLITMEE
jgi:tyrocidine synthetase-3